MLNYLKEMLSRLRGEQNINKLKNLGLKVGKNCKIQSGCAIDSSHCWLISIGNNVTLAPRVQLIAHDASTKNYLNYTKIGLISIDDNTFVGAGSIVLPNVRIGKNCIIGAGSVVTKSLPAGGVYGGNPAKFITSTSDYLTKNKALIKIRPVYDKGWTLSQISNSQKKKMCEELKENVGFIE